VKSDEPYLVYIRDSITHIEQLTSSGKNELADQSFAHSLAAILYYLHTMAEASQRLSDELKSHYPEIDWPGIAGFRNRLVHGYLHVNTAIVWSVLQNDLPPLKAVILRILQNLDGEST
jgi:uncharacterized protein with HEPN domain